MRWLNKFGVLLFAVAVLIVVVLICYHYYNAKEIVTSLIGLLGSLLGIVLGSYFIQRLVNRENSLKETSRWLIQKIDEYEKNACDCCFLAKEDSRQRTVLSSKLKSDFPVLSHIFDTCVCDQGKRNAGNLAWKNLFDASTGGDFEFSSPSLDDARLIIPKITRSCSQLKCIVAQCL